MIYDHLTPEQSQRAEALHAAATSFGSPSGPTDDYLVRAANWIITGLHDALFPLQVMPTEPAEPITDEDPQLDGGGVNQAAPEEKPQPRIGVNVGREFSKAQSGPTIEDVDTDQPED